MEIKKEKAFPRGGKKPALNKSKNNFNLSLFKKPKPKIKKKKSKKIDEKKKSRKFKISKPKESLKVKFVEDLKASVVQDGMLILGIVSQITEKIVNISLPGRIKGAITLANVSEFFKSLIEGFGDDCEVPSLKNMFEVGEILPVKVLSVSEDYGSLLVTCNPKSVNSKLSYNLIEEGFILVGNVKSQEDHGFIIDFGIENLNGFLNYKKVDPNKNLVVGRIVRCCIIKCNQGPGSCNVEVSLLKEDLQLAIIKKNSALPMYCMVPGFQLEVTLEKSLNDGVEVSYGKENSLKGFIYEDHLLKKFTNSAKVEIGSLAVGTLLYVKPLINIPYFKVFPSKPDNWPFEYGKIISGKVVKVKRSGVYFKVCEETKTAKCFVPLSKLKNAKSFIKDQLDIVNLYPVNKKVSKIRLGITNLMGRYYIGATDKASINEKYYSVSDLNCGDTVSCKIVSFEKSTAHLAIGPTLTGVVSFGDMTDIPLKNPTSKFKIGQIVKARVLVVNPVTRFIRLTMKPTLLKEKKILCSKENCREGESYVGKIFKVMHNKLKVTFFNQLCGIIPKQLTPFPDSSLKKNYVEGQLLKCMIVSLKKNSNIYLSLLMNNNHFDVEVGKEYKVAVINKTESGLFLDVEIDVNKKCHGYMPMALLTDHYSLTSALHSTYIEGEKLTAYCVVNNKTELPIFGLDKIFNEFYENKCVEDMQKSLFESSVIPFLYNFKNKKTGVQHLQNIVPGKNNMPVIVIRSDFTDSFLLSKYQLVYGKILKMEKKKIVVSIKLKDVWDKNFENSLTYLDSYLMTLNFLIKRQKENLKAYNEVLHLGSFVTGIIEEVRTNTCVLRTDANDLCLLQGKYIQGQKVDCMVIWIDVSDQMIYVCEKINVEESNKKRRSFVLDNANLRAKILFISSEVVVLELKGQGKGQLAFFPRRRHINDFLLCENVFLLGEELKVWITRKNSNYLLAMDRRIISVQEKMIWKNFDQKLKQSVGSLKRKLEEEKKELRKKQKPELESEVEVVNIKPAKNSDTETLKINEIPEVKEEIEVDDDLFNTSNYSFPRLEYDDVEIKSESDNEDKKSPQLENGFINEERIILSSSSEDENEENSASKINKSSKPFKIEFNWDVLNNQSLLSGVVLKKEESSESEEDESKSEKKKKKHLTANEKREKAKSEEERLRLIEDRLMDANREPESADDFDRAVLSNPDSSALWLKYMAFHIQGTEIEKARAVANRALKAISFREEQEKLNIWIALLNLENMYGSEDSLNKTLHEALQSNDPCKIHLHMLNIHGQSNRLQEMEKLGNFMLKKYRDVQNMWCDVASAYFSVGKVESARNVLQRALKVVDKSFHVSLITKFAQLENKYGNPERAQTLYESVLSSFPKRVDIWCCYVDMLIKSNHIDLARQVLERATSQRLRPRKMKILFKKFITFEETHGTAESLEKVREAAVEYVQTVGGDVS